MAILSSLFISWLVLYQTAMRVKSFASQQSVYYATAEYLRILILTGRGLLHILAAPSSKIGS
jgi:hypothetical protein